MNPPSLHSSNLPKSNGLIIGEAISFVNSIIFNKIIIFIMAADDRPLTATKEVLFSAVGRQPIGGLWLWSAVIFYLVQLMRSSAQPRLA